MRTFEKYTHCLFPNKELYWQAFQYAKSKGVPVWDGQKDSYSAFVVSFLFNEYPCNKDGRKHSFLKKGFLLISNIDETEMVRENLMQTL